MATTENQVDSDVIELEPTIAGVGFDSLGDPYRQSAADAAVALVPGAPPTVTGENNTLLRRRLAGAALILAVMYTLLFAYNFFKFGIYFQQVWHLIAARSLIAAGIAAILMSPLQLSGRWIRALEVALFGGLMILVVIAQYKVNHVIMLEGDLPGMVSFMKNGVIQAVIIIMIFGSLIPNRPPVLAWGVLLMALAPLLGTALLTERADVAAIVSEFDSIHQSTTDAVFLLGAAGIAFYSGIVLNGMRAALREARKFGQYQLIRKLGEGGMGEVHLAEHQLLKRPCALKLIKEVAGAEPLALARFEREVQAAARLQHPNSIEIYDYGQTDDGTFYYVMEYLKGLSLAELVDKDGPLPPGRVVYLFRQACAALAEAHELGLVHRDLKPANLFIAVRGGEADVAKILDFGLVKLTAEPHDAELTQENTVSGTPLYMSPEQGSASRDLDARADIYSLGAMMYYALTAQPPFKGESPMEVMIANARDPVQPPSKHVPSIPADLDQAVLRCLAKRPDDRFPNVKALNEALAACQCTREWGANRAEAWWEFQNLETT